MTLSCHLIRCICNKSQSLNIWKSKLWFTLGVDKEMPPLPLSDQWLPSAPWSSTLFKQLRLSRNNNPYCLTPGSIIALPLPGYTPGWHLLAATSFLPSGHSGSPLIITTLATSPCWYSALEFIKYPSVDGVWLIETPSYIWADVASGKNFSAWNWNTGTSPGWCSCACLKRALSGFLAS